MFKKLALILSAGCLAFSMSAQADDLYFYACTYGSHTQTGYIAGEYRNQARMECRALGGSYADHRVAF
ncbi:hypothetical protein SG34_009950 [Thalassomonas viridans]|uniref:Uncharacterized protein n=1 Tax=Thalassomonas viridans TaxID=137584 RepID=A0AAE9Z6T7_9GAMM|nr:hypothetical protein [Thalassomonas viridans]WDE07179.1 hypothetical protein SG34_009950 [Thalassomonas viridans]